MKVGFGVSRMRNVENKAKYSGEQGPKARSFQEPSFVVHGHRSSTLDPLDDIGYELKETA